MSWWSVCPSTPWTVPQSCCAVVDPMADVDGDAATQLVHQASPQRHEQDLVLLADEDCWAAFGKFAPDSVVGPFLVAGNELNPIGIAEIVVAKRRSHE